MAKINEPMCSVASKIPEKDKNILIKYCEENDDTISRIIRRLIKDFIDKEGL